MRLFVALPIPAPGAAALTQALAGLPAIRPVAPGTWHVTLRFLGEVLDVAALEAALGDALRGRPALPCVVEGLGAFPSAKAARVLWAGVRAPGIEALAAAVEGATARFGEPPERRRFVAHATLARLGRPSDVRSLVDQHAGTLVGQGVLERVVLYDSVGGAYVERAAWRLGPGA